MAELYNMEEVAERLILVGPAIRKTTRASSVPHQ